MSTLLPPDIAAWFGDFADDVTDEQAGRIIGAFERIEARWPDDDDQQERTEAMSGATQVILGDDTLEAIADQWRRAAVIEREHAAKLGGALMASLPESEHTLAARAGVQRGTVRRALGRSVR